LLPVISSASVCRLWFINAICCLASIPFSSILPGIILTYLTLYEKHFKAVEQSATPVTFISRCSFSSSTSSSTSTYGGIFNPTAVWPSVKLEANLASESTPFSLAPETKLVSSFNKATGTILEQPNLISETTIKVQRPEVKLSSQFNYPAPSGITSKGSISRLSYVQSIQQTPTLNVATKQTPKIIQQPILKTETKQLLEPKQITETRQLTIQKNIQKQIPQLKQEQKLEQVQKLLQKQEQKQTRDTDFKFRFKPNMAKPIERTRFIPIVPFKLSTKPKPITQPKSQPDFKRKFGKQKESKYVLPDLLSVSITEQATFAAKGFKGEQAISPKLTSRIKSSAYRERSGISVGESIPTEQLRVRSIKWC